MIMKSQKMNFSTKTARIKYLRILQISKKSNLKEQVVKYVAPSRPNISLNRLKSFSLKKTHLTKRPS